MQNERIKLRNELIDQFKKLSILIIKSNNIMQFIKSNSFKQKLILNPILKEKYELYVSEFKSEEEAKYCISNITDISEHICPICNINICQFYYNKTKRGYNKTCSKECQSKLMSNITKSKEIIQKRETTNLRKYKVKNVAQSPEIQKRIQNTNMLRYNVNYTLQLDEIQKRINETNLRKYKVKRPLQLKEIQLIIQNSYIKKYGVKSHNQKNIKNYNIWSNDDKFKEFIINKYNEKGMFLTLVEIAEFFNVSLNCIRYRLENHLDLLQYFYIQQSNLEIIFEKFLINNNISYKKNDRSLLLDSEKNIRQEIDFLCGNIGFEINDIATHNSSNSNIRFSKDKYYHYNKSLLAKKNNIYLIHIWEWEIRNNNEWDKLSKWILNILNNSKIQIDINNCKIRLVCNNEEKDFIDKYHLDGYKESDICLGIYYNDELLQIMSFIYNNDNNWELLSLCTKYNFNIKNGYKYLLDYFISNYKPKYIIAYCNLDKYNSKIYDELEFKLNQIEESLIWCNKEMNHILTNIDNNKEYISIYTSGKLTYKRRL